MVDECLLWGWRDAVGICHHVAIDRLSLVGIQVVAVDDRDHLADDGLSDFLSDVVGILFVGRF